MTTAWRYFGRDSGTGKIYEIYRCPANGKPIDEQNLADVYLLLSDAPGGPNMRETLIKEMCTGWFSEKQEEISEQEMQELCRTWQAGTWPGRK